MTATNQAPKSGPLGPDLAGLAARLLLGGLFLYMGLNKALHPVDFLKLVRQYELFENPYFLNFVAATLPWFEVFCGLLLVLGIAVRGSALAVLAMLAPFTVIVINRALGIAHAQNLPFCAIKFDCGCGTGEILICRKIVENALLMLLSIWLLLGKGRCLALRFELNPGTN
jgi:uncharacterized membrane protein YphA (DoxX/SURF4 family)